MKRILVLVLCLMMILPLAACSSSLDDGAALTETATADEKDTGPIEYPDEFSVGYSRINISGSLPMQVDGKAVNKIHDPLMLTCVAVWDGESAALLMSADLKGMEEAVATKSAGLIEKAFGVPADRIVLTCTHTHTAWTAGASGGGTVAWMKLYEKNLIQVVDEALRDLDPVDGAYIGSAETDSVTFVRRFLMEDGTYKMNAWEGAVEHESEADPELRTIRFDRKNKKDVLMVNYQTHYGGAATLYPDSISADFVHPFRRDAEKELDCLFAYYSGAGANVNFRTPFAEKRKYNNYEEAIDGFMETTKEALAGEVKAELGKIVSQRSMFDGVVKHDPEERVNLAASLKNLPDNEESLAKLKAAGFDSKWDASYTVLRASLGETQTLPFNAITFGDIAFSTAPYEMFDTNGKDVRDASPFKTTFICTLSGGHFGYLPSALAYPHGGYEVVVSHFVGGTAETFAGEMIRLLNACKDVQ